MSSPLNDLNDCERVAADASARSERTPLLTSSAAPSSQAAASPDTAAVTFGSPALTSIARVQAALSSLSSAGSNASTPRQSPALHGLAGPPLSSRTGKALRVGLDAAVVHNQQKWKRLADISDDNSTAKHMASEVQREFMQHRKRDRDRSRERERERHVQIQLQQHDDADVSLDLEDPLVSPTVMTPRDDSPEYLIPETATIEADKFLIAAAFVRDGVHGRKIGYRLDRTALFLNDLFHSASYRGVYMLVAAIACLLAFAETPTNLDDFIAVDVVCLVMFAIDVALRWYMSSDETKRQFVHRQPWAFVRLLLVVVTCVDIATHVLSPSFNPHRYARALRPYFLITRGRNIRIIFASCLRALREVVVVLLLMGCLICFFGLLGFLVFSDYSSEEAAPYFVSLHASLYTMLLIHNCLPYMVKAMFPYYVRTHWSALFFIVFVLLTNLFLLKLTIAVSYRSYKQHTEAMLYKRLQKRKAALFAAFDILAQDVDAIDDTRSVGYSTAVGAMSPSANAGRTTRGSLARGSSRYFGTGTDNNTLTPRGSMSYAPPGATRQLSIESWIRLCEHLRPHWSSTEARLVFNTVDVEHVGRLALGDFYQLCSLLNVRVERAATSSRHSLLRKLFTSSRYQRVKRLRVRLRNVLVYETLLFGRYPVVVAELVVGALICLSVLQAVQVNNIALAFSVNRSWRVLGFCLLVLFTLEVCAKLFAFGRREFFARPFCKLDLAIVSVGWVFYALTSVRDAATISRTLYDLALAVRSLRVLKLLNMVPPFHAMLWTMQRIAALIVQLLLVIFCVVYSFAIFTQANYGAALRAFPADKQALSPSWYAVRDEFQVDTFEQALVTLFGVANLAGWDMVMDAAHAVTNNDATYVFFFSYRITIATILLPIFVGFLVESFVSNAKSVDVTYETYVEAVAHENEIQRDEDALAVLQSKDPSGCGYAPPASPVSCSSDGELRIKYERRGSLVHNQMFDAVKISDVSRLSLLVDRKDDEIATNERTIRRLESNALTMQSRASASQRLLLQYEAKMEELSAVLQDAKDEIVRQQQALDALHQSRRPSLQTSSTGSRRSSWRVWNQ